MVVSFIYRFACLDCLFVVCWRFRFGGCCWLFGLIVLVTLVGYLLLDCFAVCSPVGGDYLWVWWFNVGCCSYCGCVVLRSGLWLLDLPSCFWFDLCFWLILWVRFVVVCSGCLRSISLFIDYLVLG